MENPQTMKTSQQWKIPNDWKMSLLTLLSTFERSHFLPEFVSLRFQLGDFLLVPFLDAIEFSL